MHRKRISIGAGKNYRWAQTPRNKGGKAITLIELLRDKLQYADNAREAREILNNQLVYVDGKPVKDGKQAVGVMDVISLPQIKTNYRLMPGKKNLELREIKDSQAKVKLCRVTGKKKLKKGKIQLALHDGSTLLYDKKAKVNDTILLTLPERKVQKVLPFKKGSSVIIYHGRHSGEQGKLEDTLDGTQTRKSLSTVEGLQTMTDYIFVVGEDKPEAAL